MSEPTPETTPAPSPEPTGGPTAIGPTQRGAGKKAGWVRKRGWRRPHPRRKKKDPKPTTTSTKPNPRSGKTSTRTVIVKTTSQAAPSGRVPQPGAPADTEKKPVARLRPARRAISSSTPRPGARLLARSRTTPGPIAVPGVRIVEDHHLDQTGRAKAWEELVDWVIWLHDRYELSREHRLPECWPAHPGLVEELSALKAWRTEIYTPPTVRRDGPPAPVVGNGGPARAWQAELRNVLHAASTHYAPGCRAGHKDTLRQATGDEALRTRWLGEPPLVVNPRGAPAPTVTAGPPGMVMTDQGMTRATAQGLARPLHPSLPGFTRHNGYWWAATGTGHWIAVTDPATKARLDQAHRSLRTADQATSSASKPTTEDR